MQYDVALKELFHICQHDLLTALLQLPVRESTLLEEKPQETVSMRRSDFVLQITQEDGESLLVVMEFQTRWEPDVPIRMLEYRVRQCARTGLDAISVVLLLTPSSQATPEYKDREVHYRYRLIKLYDLDAEVFIRKKQLCMLPLTPLMQHGPEMVFHADELIVASNLPIKVKAEMLTSMTLITGLVSKEKAQNLVKRRQDMLTQSAGYQYIIEQGWQKGWQEGLEKGIEQGIEQGMEEGLTIGRREGLRTGLVEGIALALEFKFGIEGMRLLPVIENIHDVGKLQTIQKVIRSVQTPAELRDFVESL